METRQALFGFEQAIGCPERLTGNQRAALQWACVEEFDSVLEASCENSALLATLSERFRVRAWGLNRDGKNRTGFPEMITGDAEHIPLAGGTLDTVFMTRMPEGSVSEKAFSEIARIMRPGGQLVLVLPGLAELLFPGKLFSCVSGRRKLMRRIQSMGFSHVSWRRCGIRGVIIAWKKTAFE